MKPQFMLQHLWVGKKAVGRCWDVNVEGIIQSECFCAWACPIHLRGTHLPQCQMQTLATFEQGRTISFLLRVCQMFLRHSHAIQRMLATVTRVDTHDSRLDLSYPGRSRKKRALRYRGPAELKTKISPGGDPDQYEA